MPHSEPLEADDPRRVGAYRLTGRLGVGGQGVVYLGEPASAPEGADPADLVAVKLLHSDWVRDTTALGRLGKEVAAARRVASFCTARVVDADLDARPPYVVSEYIEGPTLLAQVSERGPLTGSRLLRLAVGTATALTAIHQHGVVHRDFKPGNIILGPDGPRVIDFGIAREQSVDASGTTGVVGTPVYMAPEHFVGTPIGPAADVFAWASTMVYAATGRGPFTAPTLAAIMNRVINDDPTIGELPEPLSGLVHRCLTKDPAARPTSRDALLALLADTESTVPRNTPIFAAASHAAQTPFAPPTPGAAASATAGAADADGALTGDEPPTPTGARTPGASPAAGAAAGAGAAAMAAAASDDGAPTPGPPLAPGEADTPASAPGAPHPFFGNPPSPSAPSPGAGGMGGLPTPSTTGQGATGPGTAGAGAWGHGDVGSGPGYRSGQAGAPPRSSGAFGAPAGPNGTHPDGAAGPGMYPGAGAFGAAAGAAATPPGATGPGGPPPGGTGPGGAGVGGPPHGGTGPGGAASGGPLHGGSGPGGMGPGALPPGGSGPGASGPGGMDPGGLPPGGSGPGGSGARGGRKKVLVAVAGGVGALVVLVGVALFALGRLGDSAAAANGSPQAQASRDGRPGARNVDVTGKQGNSTKRGKAGQQQARKNAKRKAKGKSPHHGGKKDKKGRHHSAPEDSSAPQPTQRPHNPPKPKPNRYTPVQACGSGYRVLESHPLYKGGARVATVYLLWDNGSGNNCAVTMRSDQRVGKKRVHVGATLQRRGGHVESDAGQFLWYGGPVRLHAPGTCVRYGGSFGSVSFTSPYGHCG